MTLSHLLLLCLVTMATMLHAAPTTPANDVSPETQLQTYDVTTTTTQDTTTTTTIAYVTSGDVMDADGDEDGDPDDLGEELVENIESKLENMFENLAKLAEKGFSEVKPEAYPENYNHTGSQMTRVHGKEHEMNTTIEREVLGDTEETEITKDIDLGSGEHMVSELIELEPKEEADIDRHHNEKLQKLEKLRKLKKLRDEKLKQIQEEQEQKAEEEKKKEEEEAKEKEAAEEKEKETAEEEKVKQSAEKEEKKKAEDAELKRLLSNTNATELKALLQAQEIKKLDKLNSSTTQ